LFEATSCDRYFSDYASNSGKIWKITISMLNNFFTIGFIEKIVLLGYRNSYPRISKIRSYLTFDLLFKVKPRSICLFWT
jgi:hypothetical protein